MAERRRASTLINALALGAGIVGLVIVIDQLGWQGMRRAVIGIGGWFAVIAAIDLASASCDAFAIHGFVRSAARVSYARVFAAQISGMAINRLTPGNSLGEPVKVAMLVRHVPATAAVSSVVLFNLTTVYVAIATIAFGVPVTALLLDLPERIELAVWIALAILGAVAIILGLLVRRGALGTLVDGLAAMHVISDARATRWRSKVVDIDRRVRDIRHAGLPRGIAGVIGSRVLNSVGTIVVLHAADIPLTAPLVIASLSVGILVTWISNVVPLGLGVADGTNYVLYGLLGASPVAGLLFTMVNRLRTCVLAAIGLTVMTIANFAHRRSGT